MNLNNFFRKLKPESYRQRAETLCFFIFIIVSVSHALYPLSVHADPDFIATGFTYSKAASLQCGTQVHGSRFYTGGFVHIRNHPAFNMEYLPNHTWRGNIEVYCKFLSKNIRNRDLELFIGLEHESSHATMGIMKPIENKHEQIFDGQYRRCNLNSVSAKILYRYEFSDIEQIIIAESQVYGFTKNTPELPGSILDKSAGFSLGTDLRRSITSATSFMVSLYSRMIFEGKKTALGKIATDSPDGVHEILTRYHTIRSVSTYTASIGLCHTVTNINSQVIVFAAGLYGNIFGYADSRDIHQQMSIGISLVH